MQRLFESSFVPCQNLEYNLVAQWQNFRAQEFANCFINWVNKFRILSFSKI